MHKVKEEITRYGKLEERLNYLTHGLGAIVSLVGLYFLITYSSQHQDGWVLIGSIIFGLTLIAMFTSSTIYHWVSSFKWKKRFRLVDHAAIYLLIAGTYTPFTLGNLRADWGIWMFGIIWAFALIGVIYKLLIRNNMEKFGHLDTWMYVLLGFFIIPFLQPALEHIPTMGMIWLSIGGACYTIGAIFYAVKRIPYNHAIWHLFVMGGAACHYFSVLYYVLPPSL